MSFHVIGVTLLSHHSHEVARARTICVVGNAVCPCASLEYIHLTGISRLLHHAQVGARERVEDDGAKWLNFIMKRPEIAALAV
eukprot:scaffold104899_cov39-Tisochrysis_lutea.AAC.3